MNRYKAKHKRGQAAPSGCTPAAAGSSREFGALPLSDNAVCAVYSLALATIHYIMFSRFLPTSNGTLGHDYRYSLPKLLSGYYWFESNGPLAVPWFAPGFCGGTPFYPNPQSMYYLLPQFATLMVSPLEAVRLTFFVFTALGCAGTYLLMRQVFAVGQAAALVGAAIFTFNGFYAHRMLIGHLSFHFFMLLPLVALFLLSPVSATTAAGKLRSHVVLAALAGIAFAFIFPALRRLRPAITAAA